MSNLTAGSKWTSGNTCRKSEVVINSHESFEVRYKRRAWKGRLHLVSQTPTHTSPLVRPQNSMYVCLGVMIAANCSYQYNFFESLPRTQKWWVLGMDVKPKCFELSTINWYATPLISISTQSPSAIVSNVRRHPLNLLKRNRDSRLLPLVEGVWAGTVEDEAAEDSSALRETSLLAAGCSGVASLVKFEMFPAPENLVGDSTLSDFLP